MYKLNDTMFIVHINVLKECLVLGEKNFLEAGLQEIKDGYSFDADKGIYKCLICGEVFEAGEIFSLKGRFYEAYKAIELHVKEKHSSMAEILLGFDKKYTYLSLSLTTFIPGIS